MLYPQNNKCRRLTDLAGFWDLKPDPDKLGEYEEWYRGFETETVVGVPGSWNEQLAEAGLMNFVGGVWYQKRFYTAEPDDKQLAILRFGAADFNARVWLNGQYLGEHRGGFLPFEFDVTTILVSGEENLLVLCIDNILDHDSIPQGLNEQDYLEFGKERELTFPATVFDFFAYGGLSRNVSLYYRHEAGLEQIKTVSRIDGATGKIDLLITYASGAINGEVRITVSDHHNSVVSAQAILTKPEHLITLTIKDCKLWSPESPHLYTLHIALYQENKLIDEYRQQMGVREIKVSGDRLLLNGAPLFLKGFGKHEDFPVLGHGLSYPLIVKDFQMMRWIGANSFRTSHYPYSEEIMQLADRLGFLVIDEVPAVSLNFKYVSDKTLTQHKNMLTELIRRDQNHPCVIAWSIANEPGIWGEPEAISAQAHTYWQEVYNHTKTLDDTRPITLPTCAKWGLKDPAYDYSDFIAINRYWGWYEIPGDPEKAGKILKQELEAIYAKFGKPVMLTEFGADTLEGAHATYPQMFTEEYQTDLLHVYFEVIASLKFMVGEHVWNFADFMTAQNHRRVILNKKGVFNRQREPKSAAFAVRRHWLG